MSFLAQYWARRFPMFRALARLLRKKAAPREPFVDPTLGRFEFEQGLGWKNRIALTGREVELVLGADGEPPTPEMLQMAQSWVAEWSSRSTAIREYIRHELAGWGDEPNLPVPERLEVESIQLLWGDEPRASMIYFHNPGDDIRAWHVTFDGFEPQGLAYDD